MLRKIFCSIYLMLFASYVLACKDRMEVSDYPLTELDNASIVVEAKITNLKEFADGHYTATKSFKAIILQSFKGDLATGKTVRVTTSKEEAHAACPVRLEKGKTYILVLKKNGRSIEISRFNIIVNSENENYQKFINQIKNAGKP